MPQYFFDIHVGDRLVQDRDGQELDNRLEVGKTAISRLRSVGVSCPAAEDVRRGFVVYSEMSDSSLS